MKRFVAKPITMCAVYVLIHKDISDLTVYPLQPYEVFRAKIIDYLDDDLPVDSGDKSLRELPPAIQGYQSISGFSAPQSKINKAVLAFLDAVDEHTRVLVIEEFASPDGMHPIP